ncbi:MAG: hypothetical protein U9Q78_07675 [Chloroflexota bacterium]|nr:hypothetical protein [Chloroflexota bacterium]
MFFMDNELEREIEAKVVALLETAENHRVSETAEINVADIADFLGQRYNALDVILRDVGLSEEKFKRIVSLLRKLGRIPGDFTSEWGMGRVKSKITREPDFARLVAELLVDGKRDEELGQYVPRYYLDMLNYREIKDSSQAARRMRYKQSLAGTYGGRKGHRVEDKIREKMEEIKDEHGVGYGKGRSRLFETDLDFVVPSTEDPWSLS